MPAPFLHLCRALRVLASPGNRGSAHPEQVAPLQALAPLSNPESLALDLHASRPEKSVPREGQLGYETTKFQVPLLVV